MASRITTQGLVDKAMQFLTTDVKDKALELFVKEAVVQADRALRNVDEFSPLAWDIVPFDDKLRTHYAAEISAITLADPTVVTAASQDDSVTGHGFRDESTFGHEALVAVDSIVASTTWDADGTVEELNGKTFVLDYVDATTFKLRTIDRLDYVATTGYQAYDSGGIMYHAGWRLDPTKIEANLATVWTFKKIVGVSFDGYGADPISEYEVMNEKCWTDVSNAQRPKRFRHWESLVVTDSATPTIYQYLFWYPVADAPYNVQIFYQKEVPDISTWDSTHYPHHPAEVHECLWHGALAILAGNAKRVQRQTADMIATQMEVLFAEHWMNIWEQDKARVLNLSRQMLGAKGSMGGFRG